LARVGGRSAINSSVTHTLYEVFGDVVGKGLVSSNLSTNELIQGNISGKGFVNIGFDVANANFVNSCDLSVAKMELIGPASVSFDVGEISRYVLVQLRTMNNIDILLDGPSLASQYNLIGGNFVWVSNQGNVSENGVYRIGDGMNLVFYAQEDGTYIDQGATALDYIDGDISRLVVADYSTVDYNRNGIYYITYYVTNSSGISSSIKRRVKVTYENASIIPVGDVKITEYSISTSVNKTLIKNKP
jgi:hypothetical protein